MTSMARRDELSRGMFLKRLGGRHARRGAPGATARVIGSSSRSTVYPRKGIVKLLLTSAGIKNASSHDALVDLLGKPIAESNALCILTAAYARPGGAGLAWRQISGRATTPLCELGWKSLGVLELTALPSIDEQRWVPMVQETDALLVGGRCLVSVLLDAPVRTGRPLRYVV
jgi:hypothetical protein